MALSPYRRKHCTSAIVSTDSCIILWGDDIFCRIERQLQAMKDGSVDLENAISRALKFIEGERDEIVD
eukprot:4976704-Ditylum_brightwellii.AAC.1